MGACREDMAISRARPLKPERFLLPLVRPSALATGCRGAGRSGPSGVNDAADLSPECQHPVTADDLRLGGAPAEPGGPRLPGLALTLSDEGRRHPPAASPVLARASCGRPGDRLPVLPHDGADLLVRGLAADPHLHDVPLPDLVDQPDAPTGADQPGGEPAPRLDEGAQPPRF